MAEEPKKGEVIINGETSQDNKEVKKDNEKVVESTSTQETKSEEKTEIPTTPINSESDSNTSNKNTETSSTDTITSEANISGLRTKLMATPPSTTDNKETSKDEPIQTVGTADTPNTSNGNGNENIIGSNNTTTDTGKDNSSETTKDDEKPWDTKVPTNREEVIAELRTHSGMAENVAIAMVDGLIAAKDPALRDDYIQHISWHLATGGPTTKENGSKGKARHKDDIIAALENLK